jgi:hypothetical protein
MAIGIAPGMVVTRSGISEWWMTRGTANPQPLFDAGDWRIDALGTWLEAFVAGEAGVSIAWKNGRPTLTDK